MIYTISTVFAILETPNNVRYSDKNVHFYEHRAKVADIHRIKYTEEKINDNLIRFCFV